MSGLSFPVPDDLVEAIAARVLERLRAEPAGEPGSPYLTVAEAADYLRWPRERVYKLTAAKAIPHIRHEGRILLRRDEIDAWLDDYREGPR